MAGSISLLGKKDVERLLSSEKITPHKYRGQNFVIDPGTVRKIAKSAEITINDRVVEIGPGLGSLTLALLEKTQKLSVVEIDTELAKLLPTTLTSQAPQSQVTIVKCDALQMKQEVLPEKPNVLVSNLPYNLAVPIILHALTSLPSVERCIVMVQKEVAVRLTSTPGSRQYGVPTAKLGFFGFSKMLFDVDATVFWPRPRVQSSVIRIDRFSQPKFHSSLQEDVFSVIDSAFSMRRKTLRASLKTLMVNCDAAKVFDGAEIDASRRPETLSTEEFVTLTQKLKEQGW